MKTHSGFTLLEVLVALAVLAIALSAVTQSIGVQANNAAYLRDRSLAHWVAVNRLTELRLQAIWPAPGKTEGQAAQGHRDWYWQQTVEETLDTELRRVIVQVRYPREATEPLATVTGFIGLPDSGT